MVFDAAGSKCDSYDNAMAESVNGLYKADAVEQFKKDFPR